ncbi:glycerophosphodiester phosphodiesterase family protein [Nocardiopsis sp. CNT312]|uniref:glycerophosphodiester phosphodiesterase n=1 Tax=Nocardiopsis sp. CNT312 TaxID=1137268 RepID=UPI00048A6D96|nr:glycerophosphodiester phosphodiesterase family protein [Nocardiopsis sp. CNT312]
MRRIGIIVGAASLFVVAGAGAAGAVPVLQTRVVGATAPVIEHRVFERPLIAVAHRGASGHAPENTLAAIDAAAERGAVTVEIDVQLTADGEAVIMHDTTLGRTTDVERVFPGREPYRVADFTMAEIRRLDAGSWFGSAFAGEPVPTLDEALDRLDGHGLNLFLELKAPARHPGLEEKVAERLRAHEEWLRPAPPWEARRLVVQSFDWEAVHESRGLLPGVAHGLLGRVPEDELADYAWAQMVNPNHALADPGYVAAVQRAGMEIMPYTVNDRPAMGALIRTGVDGFITDYPEVGAAAIADATGAPDGVIPRAALW